jgi:hypothetical protein
VYFSCPRLHEYVARSIQVALLKNGIRTQHTTNSGASLLDDRKDDLICGPFGVVEYLDAAMNGGTVTFSSPYLVTSKIKCFTIVFRLVPSQGVRTNLLLFSPAQFFILVFVNFQIFPRKQPLGETRK